MSSSADVAAPNPGLVIRDLAVAFRHRVVLDGVSADIRPGQVVGIVGPNGGGKSTLLLAILGLVPIVRGSVTLFGRSSSTLRARIAHVPQREVVNWEFPATVRDVVLMGRYPHLSWPRRFGRRDGEVVDTILNRIGLRDYQSVQVGQLSGGQQQRVFLARALAQEADVLLLDEPMTGIDAATREVMLTIIEEQRQAGRIVLLVTHDLAAVSCTCDCLCCVNARMVSYGPVHETYTEANLTATYGGPVIVLSGANQPASAPGHGVSDTAYRASVSRPLRGGPG
jgi:manganese/zinc/iron transport system ATP- binding protein